MTTDDGHAPHNRTSLTEAISHRAHMDPALARQSEPIFPDPSRVKKGEMERLLNMLRGHLRSQIDPSTGLPFQKTRQHTLGFLEASARILAMLGHETWAHVLAQIRDDVETGNRGRLTAFLAGS